MQCRPTFVPQNLPAPFTNINMGGLLAFEFLMMHFVEVRRWMDYKNHGSVNEVRARSGRQTRPAVAGAKSA